MRFKALLFGLLPAVFLAPAVANAGITATKHDFSGIGGIGQEPTGLCTFCHTPHKAMSTLLLWNHTLSQNVSFSWDVPETTAGTAFPTIPSDTYKGTTTKCLSCHDGSVAIGDIGWWNGGAPLPLTNNPIGDPAFQVGLGGDMSGNHPVAMPIPFNNAPSTYNGVGTGTGITLADWKADPQTLGIRLFTDDGAGNIKAGATAGLTGIECSSCHDPHNGNGVQGPYFLLGELGGSTANYICIKCHTKE